MNKEEMNQLLIILMMIVTGSLTVTAEQIQAINSILTRSVMPSSTLRTHANRDSGKKETICGMTELAQFLGVSVPTACKLSKSGRFDSARLDFGTKKHIWDRGMLLKIASNKQK